MRQRGVTRKNCVLLNLCVVWCLLMVVFFSDCPSNQTSCVKDGAAVLFENGYSEDFIVQNMLGVVIVTLFWSLLGYYGLKREEKKGYVY